MGAGRHAARLVIFAYASWTADGLQEAVSVIELAAGLDPPPLGAGAALPGGGFWDAAAATTPSLWPPGPPWPPLRESTPPASPAPADSGAGAGLPPALDHGKPFSNVPSAHPGADATGLPPELDHGKPFSNVPSAHPDAGAAAGDAQLPPELNHGKPDEDHPSAHPDAGAGLPPELDHGKPSSNVPSAHPAVGGEAVSHDAAPVDQPGFEDVAETTTTDAELPPELNHGKPDKGHPSAHPGLLPPELDHGKPDKGHPSAHPAVVYGEPEATEAPTPAPTEVTTGLIDPAYWNEVNQAIDAAAPQPPELVLPSDAGVNPWDSVLHAAKREDTDEEVEAALLGGRNAASSNVGRMTGVPYTLSFGATLMKELTAKAPERPPPSQTHVDEMMMARCPVVAVDGELRLRAPHCGQPMGSWLDAKGHAQRSAARWHANHEGGIDLAVDSAVSGLGGVEYASLRRIWSMDKTTWHLSNCEGMDRYLMEESVTKMLSDDIRELQDGKYVFRYFYRYTLKHPNGVEIAQTSLFTSDMSRIVFSLVGEEVTAPIAIATREGDWRGSGWTQCSNEPRGWRLMFPDPQVPSNAFPLAPTGSLVMHNYTLANVQDLRVAAATLFTLAAWRQEEVGPRGIPSVGGDWTPKVTLSHSMVKWILVTLSILTFVMCGCSKDFWRILRQELFKLFLRLERQALPGRATWRRKQVMYPTWWL